MKLMVDLNVPFYHNCLLPNSYPGIKLKQCAAISLTMISPPQDMMLLRYMTLFREEYVCSFQPVYSQDVFLRDTNSEG